MPKSLKVVALALVNLDVSTQYVVMLAKLTFSNFNSFVEKTEVSLVLTTRDPVLGWDRNSLSWRARL